MTSEPAAPESAAERARHLLTRPSTRRGPRRFSPFDPADVLAAARLAHRLHEATKPPRARSRWATAARGRPAACTRPSRSWRGRTTTS